MIYPILLGLLMGAFQESGAEECNYQIPGPLFKTTPNLLKSYKAVQSAHEIKETGEYPDGLRFSIFRGGCTEYGEIFVFQFVKGRQTIQDIPIWLSKAARVLADLGNASKNLHFSKQGEELGKISKTWSKKTPAQTTFYLGKDEVEMTLEEVKGTWIKIQFTIGDGI